MRSALSRPLSLAGIYRSVLRGVRALVDPKTDQLLLHEPVDPQTWGYASYVERPSQAALLYLFALDGPLEICHILRRQCFIPISPKRIQHMHARQKSASGRATWLKGTLLATGTVSPIRSPSPQPRL